MTSQLCHSFQASQAVHGADDVTAGNCLSQVNSIGVCGPQVDPTTTGRTAKAGKLIQQSLISVQAQ